MSRQQKICKYCGAEYLAMTYRSPHCGSIDCKHQHENKKYLSRWFTHVCEEYCHDALDPQFRKPKKLHNN